ncbi:hypothetical protein DPMN_052159 [Dreissena polymorpha]|uniref:Uncharacterized protein n=1 Tax=Dreissena polymorpha TaxID=45954 RepID=A0A9D4CJ70_DREPO|nr:hypothetical protein DPMN_052159 [Dreissena polymorpha]
MPKSQIIRSPADVSDPQASGRLDTSKLSARTPYFSNHRAGAWRMIARSPGHFEASGSVRINFKSHLKCQPTSISGRNQVEIKKKDLTIKAQLSPGNHPTSDSLYVYHDKLHTASVTHCTRPSGNQTGPRVWAPKVSLPRNLHGPRFDPQSASIPSGLHGANPALILVAETTDP